MAGIRTLMISSIGKSHGSKANTIPTGSKNVFLVMPCESYKISVLNASGLISVNDLAL